MSRAIYEGSNKNRISIAFAIEWNSGMESSASNKPFVLEGSELASCVRGGWNESEVGVMSQVMRSAFTP
jgi:hypothetical protein